MKRLTLTALAAVSLAFATPTCAQTAMRPNTIDNPGNAQHAANDASAAMAPGMGWAFIAPRVVPATVNIRVVRIATGKTAPSVDTAITLGERKRFVGSGFIVDPTGVVVTNKHLIDGALWITVRLQDGTELPAKLVAASPFVDLALLRVEAGRPLPTLALGDGDVAQIGEPVLAIGNPLGIGTSLSAGVVSGTQRDLLETPFDDYVQTDAAINQGNSGGPLINANGAVIGVNTALLNPQPNAGSIGLGFAISSNVVADALRHLLHPGDRPIGWIGLHLQEMEPNLSVAMELPRLGGAIVTQVDADSPAAAIGLHPGDVVLRYGGETASNARILMRKIATTAIGETRVLEVSTGGHIRQVAVSIRAWPGVNALVSDVVVANPRGQVTPPAPDFGLLLAPISNLARDAYKLGDTQGVLVAAVDRMSEANSIGLRPGAVIVQIQGQPATSPALARRLLEDAARHLAVVALLVHQTDRLSWVALHTGYESEGEAAVGITKSPAAQSR